VADIAMHTTDLSSYAGAQRLAETVEAHWRAKGLTVRCEIVAETIRDSSAHRKTRTLYHVRSNLSCAAPKGRADAA
jgi:hypothetical protein